MLFNIVAEIDSTELSSDTVDRYYDKFEGYHAAFGTGSRGFVSITMTTPAEDLEMSIRTSLAIIERATTYRVIAIQAMATDEFDRRHGFESLPELVSATEAADILGVTRQALNLMIQNRKFATATKAGTSWVIARAEVDQHREQRSWQVADVIPKSTGARFENGA